MRAPVSDAGCAVGLPYTVFPSREALVAELVGIELARNREHLEPWTTSAGRHTAGLNLDRFASLLHGAHQVSHSRELWETAPWTRP